MSNLISYPWKKFFELLYDKVFEAELFGRSAQVAFYFSFSLFPLLFFLISLFGIVLESTKGLQYELFSYLQQIMPTSAFVLVRDTVREIVENSSGGKLTLGLAVTLWSASAGVDGIRTALNSIYELRETRWWWKTKLQSLLLTFFFIIFIAFVLSIVFYGWQIFKFALAGFGFEVSSPLVLVSIQWVSIVLMMLFACEIIYNLIPDFKSRVWNWITPGSVVAILLWILLTSGFRLYLTYFNSYNRTYGSLGAVIILMLWLYLTAVAVLFGGAINAVFARLNGDDLDLSVKTGPDSDPEATSTET